MILEYIRDFFLFSCSPCVPIVFPKGFQVPKYVPQVVPYSTWVLSHMVCTKFNSPVYKLKSRGAHLFLFCKWGSKEVLLLGACPMFQKNCRWANEYGYLKKKKKKSSERTHDLINVTRNKYPQSIIVGTHNKFGGRTLNASYERCPVVNVLRHRLASWHTH